MSERLPDILIFMSDQHTPYFSGFYGDRIVDTPNMNQLVEEGVFFSECYTPNPLCGPARMAMLSGKRSADSGIFHRSTLPDTTPTFLHNLVERGYETVLIGRMHFLGADQNHGFVHHLAKDMTPDTWSYQFVRKEMSEERGVYTKTDTFSSAGAASFAGAGDSPVLQYDRYVIEEAKKYLSEPHEKPQCIFVSIYGPHFPYVAPKEDFLKYMDRMQLPASYEDKVNSSVIEDIPCSVNEEVTIACRAAYAGMIENVDRQFGDVKNTFLETVNTQGRDHIIGYISDHGDQCGDRKIFGKETFYEKSVKIPFILTGNQIEKNRRCTVPVSLMDLGPTLLELTGSAKMEDDTDGRSLTDALHGKELEDTGVVSEFLYRMDKKGLFWPDTEETTFSHGVMFRYGNYKFVTYEGFEQDNCLYDVVNDPDERENLKEKDAEMYQFMKQKAEPFIKHETALKEYKKQARIESLMRCYEEQLGRPMNDMRWKGNSGAAKLYPEICIKNPAFFEEKR